MAARWPPIAKAGFSKIPYETEQGIFFMEQGIFWSEQGISGKGREHREHPPANEAFTQPSNVR
jgi:hypothetical protein